MPSYIKSNKWYLVLGYIWLFASFVQANYLVNPSFEDTTLNAYTQAWWTGTGSFSIDSSQSKTGSQSLKIQSSSGGTATVWQLFSVHPNTAYQYTGWALTQGYSPASGKTGLEIKTGPSDTSVIQDIFSSTVANATTWTQVTVLFNTGATDTIITAILDYGLFGSGATGAVWYDDLILTETSSSSSSTIQFSLSLTAYPNGKPAFALNSVLFNPVILTVSGGSESDVLRYKTDGFNVIYIPIDYNSVIGNSSLLNFLNACKNQNMPVIIELNYGSLWSWLGSNETCNMKLSPDYSTYTSYPYQYVHNYPDIMNPATRAFHTGKLESAVAALSGYFHAPIIGFSISAYDFFHMPDGEVHPMFTTLYPHPKGEGLQTWVPYGNYAEDSYRLYLSLNSTNISRLGFSTLSSVYAPWDIDTARNLDHWRSWLLYRRWYIREYLKVTVDAIKDHTDLLVTGTFDPDFGAFERYGSPIYDYNDITDFPIYYPWGFGARKEGNLATLYANGIAHLWNQGKPVIAMKEFTSDISTPAYSVAEYLTESLPYISGCQFQYGSGEIGGAKYNAFTTSIAQFNRDNSWGTRPAPSNIAVYVSPQDINNLDKGFWAGLMLYHLDKPWDVLYSLDSINHYPYLYVPSGQPVFVADSSAQIKLANYTASGGRLVTDLLDFRTTANLISNPSFETGTLLDYSQAAWSGSPVVSIDTGNKHSGAFSLKIAGASGSASVWQSVDGIVPSREYLGSVWMLSPSTNRTNSGSGTCMLEWKSNGTPYWLGPGFGWNSLGWGTGWTQIYYPMNAEDATQFTLVCLFYMYGSGTGTVWFDDLELKANLTYAAIDAWELYK
ncbi:MAG: hypothetical protein ACE14V_01460 [bacterium]